MLHPPSIIDTKTGMKLYLIPSQSGSRKEGSMEYTNEGKR